MKLLQFLVFFLPVFAVASRRLVCGPVTAACLNPLPNGKCPKVPFCPGNSPRVLTNAVCCCSASVTQVTDQPLSVGISKAKTLNETLENMELAYIKARLDIDAEKGKQPEIIDIASRKISGAMIAGMKKLAELVDVDYFDILPQVFGDDEVEKSEKGQEVFAEMKEIYDKGEEYFGTFQKLSDDLHGK